MENSFNLVDEPWIPVRMRDGTNKILSLRDTFANSGQITRIQGDSPTQNYAVLRVLLAIIWRAHLTDPDFTQVLSDRDEYTGWWFDNLEDPQWLNSSPINDYLDRWHERFELIHSPKPFMQVNDLQTTSGKTLGIARIIPKAEKDQFTMRDGQKREALSLPEAARWLIALQAYDYSGIKPGAVGDPRVKGGKGYPIGTGWTGTTGGVVLHGRCLAQTFILNLPVNLMADDKRELDLPPWERTPDTSAPRDVQRPLGPVDILTWQVRRVRLVVENNEVVRVLVTNGDRVETANEFNDPMTAYRWSKNKSKKNNDVYYPRTHAEERTVWRSLDPLLVFSNKQPKPEQANQIPQTINWLRSIQERGEHLEQNIGVELVGVVYGTQSAVIENTIHAELEMKLQLLMSNNADIIFHLLEAAQAAQDAAIAVGQFGGRLKQALGDDYQFDPSLTERVLYDAEPDFKNWLGSISNTTNIDQAWGQWAQSLYQQFCLFAQDMAYAAGPQAAIGVMKPKGEQDDGVLYSSSLAYSWLEYRLSKVLNVKERNMTLNKINHPSGRRK
ncbi:type I-E CRISPR-associated protein Cse1/CasA [Gleimia hominis]|uniref:type I-E CRISPR-associated protein Cse1/CasA n=1 Tax=Gleimia hominis TaxID=595468 RepID=UPI000C807323|nr:type I-E CRISPR-associated protein Cse1/CasA [Gleimia hominis]WIK64367.1 type I-E CRISPR-associated protein Cse1/CasA [Gleimia hominis]